MPLEKIQYVDYPEIHINEHERTEMPFRYVRGDDGQPIMPTVCFALNYRGIENEPFADRFQGMVDLIKKDAEKSIDDLF